MLKLTVIDVTSPLVRDRPTRNLRHPSRPEIRKQLAKLTALLRQEAVSKIFPPTDTLMEWKKSMVFLLVNHPDPSADGAFSSKSGLPDEARETTEGLEATMVCTPRKISVLFQNTSGTPLNRGIIDDLVH